MNCFKCSNVIEKDKKHLKCVQCKNSFHLSCLDEVTESDHSFIMESKNSWKCSECVKSKSIRGDETPVTPTSEKSKFHFSNSDSEGTNLKVAGTKPKAECRKCRKGFSHNAHRAKCSKCNNVFHFGCSLTKDEFMNVEKSWVCQYCSPKEKTDIVEVEMALRKTEKESITLLDILKEMRSFRNEVAEQNKEFTNSLNVYSEWIKENTEQMKSIDLKLDSIAKDIDVLQQENCNLKQKNELLTKKIVDLEQASRDNTVEIYGVPYKNNEDLFDILNKISQAINFTFNSEMIDNCYRIKSTAGGPAQSRSIVVRFLRKLDKESFIAKRRQKRNVNSRDLGFMEGEASPVYINESLTQDKRKILNAARAAKQEKRYTFIWVKNGRVFVRKNPGDAAIVINSMEDIAKLA